MIPTTAKLGKNQFKCFHCRLIFPQRDGDWFNWKSMQVHLCFGCNKITEQRPERASGPSLG
jgi:hypothetical protein